VAPSLLSMTVREFFGRSPEPGRATDPGTIPALGVLSVDSGAGAPCPEGGLARGPKSWERTDPEGVRRRAIKRKQESCAEW